MMFITPLILNSKIAVSQPQPWFDDRSEIQHIEYYVEFSPELKGYSTTKYAIDLEAFEIEGDSVLNVDITYDDLDLTEAGENFNYNILLDSREILEHSNILYGNLIIGTHTELFLDLNKIGNSQTFRVDETLTFADYLKKEVYKGINKLDLSFSYIGEKQYSKNLTHTFNTYHYQAYSEWTTQGIY